MPLSLQDMPSGVVELTEMTFLSGEFNQIEEIIQQNMNKLFYRYANVLLPYILN
jgi:hypothetical protein